MKQNELSNYEKAIRQQNEELGKELMRVEIENAILKADLSKEKVENKNLEISELKVQLEW